MSRLPSGYTSSFDLVVIGAGSNGAAIARDAALRGLRTLLLDKGDIGSGTTSRSTRLIHGGLRYLEHFEVALVRESLRERQTLLSIAPHLVKPLTFLIPIYESGSRRPAQIRIGLLAYSALSGRKKLERHQMLNRDEVLEREPGLNPEGLKAGAVYYDAQAEFPERLAVENALSAAENGAHVLSYARVERLVVDAGTVRGVEFQDQLTGTTHTVKAKVTVNATGPWADDTLNGLGSSAQRLIGGTKGSHLVVEPFPGAPNEALYVEAPDSRPYFIVPWRGRYLIGTTDLDYTYGDLDHVRASEEEINYLITSTNQVLGGARLTRDQLLSTYAGVRPLPYTNQHEESAITRSHIVKDHAPQADGLISIVGGKITTCRSLAADTVELVFKKLGRESPACTTEKLPLPGGELSSLDEAKSQLVSNYSLDSQTADRLTRLYGARATAVLDLSRDSPELACPIDASGVLGAEIVYALDTELAQTLSDVLMRRTMVGIEPSLRSGTAIAAAVIAAKYLDWSSERAAAEVEQFSTELADLAPAGQTAQSTASSRS
jgi:glycerol-3-phosphate dehydrogenase